MKKTTTKILSILVLTLLITVTTVAAAERVKVFELAESGVNITFPMTSEEIYAEDAAKARLISIREANVTKSEKRLHIFEMAESSQTISYPMSAEEIATKDAGMVKFNVSAIKKIKPKMRVTQFELSETGEVIKFLSPEIEAVAKSTDEIKGTIVKTKVEDSNKKIM